MALQALAGQAWRMPTSLVTGPTAGLGRQFALQLAARGHDLVLVARDESRLEALAIEIEADYRASCEVIVADLSKSTQSAKVEKRVRDTHKPIDWLVNNAGFGLNEQFTESKLADEQRLLDVLVRAPMRLTHEALPGMIQRGFGRVIIVSSIASWVTNGTYSAAKAWATVFTEGLEAELAGTGVTATAVCPGYTRTEFHQRAGQDTSSTPDVLWLDAREVVAKAIADADRGRVLSVPGLAYRALGVAARTAPRAWVRRASALAVRRPV